MNAVGQEMFGINNLGEIVSAFLAGDFKKGLTDLLKAIKADPESLAQEVAGTKAFSVAAAVTGAAMEFVNNEPQAAVRWVQPIIEELLSDLDNLPQALKSQLLMEFENQVVKQVGPILLEVVMKSGGPAAFIKKLLELLKVMSESCETMAPLISDVLRFLANPEDARNTMRRQTMAMIQAMVKTALKALIRVLGLNGIMDRIKKVITNAKNWVKDKIKAFFNAILRSIRRFFGGGIREDKTLVPTSQTVSKNRKKVVKYVSRGRGSRVRLKWNPDYTLAELRQRLRDPACLAKLRAAGIGEEKIRLISGERTKDGGVAQAYKEITLALRKLDLNECDLTCMYNTSMPGNPQVISGLVNTTRLDADELATGRRLEIKLGKPLMESPHIGAEYVDCDGVSYDALGKIAASRYWDEAGFMKSIDEHLLKSNKFTAIDLTGFTASQVDAVRRYLSTLTQSQRDKIIPIGFSF